MLNLNIPKMLPDELGTAYLEHVAHGNILNTKNLLSRACNAKPRFNRPSNAQLIAEIAGLSDKDFVCFHTCKPFYSAFESAEHWCYPHGTCERRPPKNPMLVHKRVGYYLCPECSSEDVYFWGRSYWRRSHQIPGVFWCLKHEIPLIVAQDECLHCQPHEVIDASRQCTSSPFSGGNTIPGRYQKLVNSLLDFQIPVFSPRIISALKQKLSRENYSCRTNAYGRRFLSDTVLENCPHQWCNDLFPNFHNKKAGQHFREIDGIEFGQNAQTIAYVLALAVLYDDPDEAASEVSRLVSSQSYQLCVTEPIAV